MAGLHKVAPEKNDITIYILACNARSIFSKSEDLNSLAKSKMYANLSATAVTESCLASDIDSTLIIPPGFQCFLTDRACRSNRRCGGTAIFINRGSVLRNNLSPIHTNDKIEATAVTYRNKFSCKFSFIGPSKLKV